MVSKLFALALLSAAITAAAPSVLLDGTVAVIGDEIILKSELDAYTALRLGVAPQSDSISKYRKQFLSEMIDGKVLLVHAKNDSVLRSRTRRWTELLKIT